MDALPGKLNIGNKPSTSGIKLEVRGIERKAGGKKILSGPMSLVIHPGEFVGLLGPSGSGKSTLLKACCGLQRPNSGEVRFNGQDLYKSQDTWRKKMGYVPQEDIIHQELSVQKAITYAAKLRLPQELPDDRRKALVTRVIHEVGLEERKNVTIRKLSGGQRKRVSVAVELLNRPEILFLDEPTSGQDPGLEIAMMQLFKGFTRQGATVIVTTHAMASIEELDIVVLLQAGVLVFMGPPQALLEVFGGRSYEGIYQTLAKQSPIDSLNQFRRSAYAGWPGGSR